MQYAQLRDLDTSSIFEAAGGCGGLRDTYAQGVSDVNNKSSAIPEDWEGDDATAAVTKLAGTARPLDETSAAFDKANQVLNSLGGLLDTARAKLHGLIAKAVALPGKVDNAGVVTPLPTGNPVGDAALKAEATRLTGEIATVVSDATAHDQDAANKLSDSPSGSKGGNGSSGGGNKQSAAGGGGGGASSGGASGGGGGGGAQGGQSMGGQSMGGASGGASGGQQYGGEGLAGADGSALGGANAGATAGSYGGSSYGGASGGSSAGGGHGGGSFGGGGAGGGGGGGAYGGGSTGGGRGGGTGYAGTGAKSGLGSAGSASKPVDGFGKAAGSPTGNATATGGMGGGRGGMGGGMMGGGMGGRGMGGSGGGGGGGGAATASSWLYEDRDPFTTDNAAPPIVGGTPRNSDSEASTADA